MSSYTAAAATYPHQPLHDPNSSDDFSPQHGIITAVAAAAASPSAAPQSYDFDPGRDSHQQSSQNPSPIPPQQHPSAYDVQHTNGLDGASHHGGSLSIPPTTPGSDSNQKTNRLRKACDSCSVRKVKCDEYGPPCRACAALDIPCTFERPSRRRGPPNRHAEAIKKRRLDQESTGFPSPTSPNNAAAMLASLSSHAVLSAESICPIPLLELFVDDFFTYIHPLCPFPHEPSFRAAFKHREDLNNPGFLALLASMIAALVASFPRKPRLHLKAHHQQHLYPTSMSLVERCHRVSIEARGAGYLDRELTVYDAATSYFLGLAAGYTFQWVQSRLYFGECLNMARCLGLHRLKHNNSFSMSATSFLSPNEPLNEPVDYIRQEIGRRIFWATFVGVRSMEQVGADCGELHMPAPTRKDPYPPLPLEVDDQYIFVTHVDSQPPGVVPEIAGFNVNIQVYMSYASLISMELAYGIDEVFDFNRQRQIMEDCTRNVKSVLDLVPSELVLSRDSQEIEADALERQYYPPTADYTSMRETANLTSGDSTRVALDGPDSRRLMQYEIQKANFYVSALGTRSFIVEKYRTLLNIQEQIKTSSSSGSSKSSYAENDGTADPVLEAIDTQIMNERESIVKHLLRVLGSISQVNIEPNGGSLINKIRQVASTLLDQPRKRKGPLALEAEEYISRFLDIVMKLERISPDSSSDDDEELRNWADLREYQTRFVQAGGFLSD